MCQSASGSQPRFARTLLAVSLATLACSAVAEEALDLGKVVVSAAGFEQNIAEAPASISVISREELEKQSYNSVIDAVKNIPGVFVTGGGNSRDISIRGMSSDYTLVLVDGRPVSAGRQTQTNGTSGGKQEIGLPPLAMIERIEVIRGPMSSLYGSDAMGGVINIITRRGSEEWHGTLRTEYTHSLNDVSEDGHHSELFVGGALIPGLLGLQLNGAYTGIDESDFIGGESFNSGASRPETRRKNGGAEFYLTPTENDRFSLSYRDSTQKATHTEGVSTVGTTSTSRFDKEIWTLAHDGRYGSLMLNSYLQHDISERVQELTMKETVTTLNTMGTYFWGSHAITFGGQYKEEEFANGQNVLYNDGIAGGVKEADRWIGAVFTEIDWAITDDLSVTTGLRYNDDEFFGGHLSPRIYGVYQLTPSFTVKGGVSTGYKQPTLTQATEGFGGRTGGGGSPNTSPSGSPLPRALSLGNADLDPETSTNYEVGFAYDNPSNGLDFSFMAFHTKFKDKIQSDRFCESPGAANNNDVANYACEFGGNRFYFLQTGMNVDEAQMQGVEMTLGYDFTANLRLTSSYTYTESEQKSGEFKGEPLNKQPEHMFNALLDWDANERLNLWTQYNYRSRTSDYQGRTTIQDGTPGYGFVDVGLMYTLTDTVKVTAGLYNLADEDVTNGDYEVVLDGRRLTTGITIDF
ncbi:MAG: TonB-dependent receptor [Gammaproteobacteria bacterium]|nr:TonB-dependent receptor [Gammaproteobacteria bacterium]